MNLLVVDDERYIVNYLASLIHSHLEDLEILKSYSAIEALKILSLQKVDILLLDIQMPGMTGLELAEKVSKSWPRCRIIFLSAYDNFDYVYQANHCAHASYLLKTESDETILAEIQKNIDSIEQESRTQLILDDAQKKNRFLSHLLQQSILQKALYGSHVNQLKAELQIAGSTFPLDITKPVYLGCMLTHLHTIDEYIANLSRLTMEYLCPAEEFLRGSFSYAMMNLNHGTMLWFLQPLEDFSDAVPTELTFLKGFAEDLADYSTTALHRELNFILYPQAVDWEHVQSVYYQLFQQLEVSRSQNACPVSSVVLFNKNEKPSALPVTTPKEQGITEQKLQALSFSLYQNSPEEYFQILEKLQETCCALKSMHSLPAVRIYMEISVMLISYVNLYQLQEKLAAQAALYPLYHLETFSSWKQAFDYLKRFSHHLFGLLSSSRSTKNEAVIQRIKSYVREHLSENISLSALSEILNYNETYISRLFRQGTGIKLSEYIFQERIAKARYLLSTTGNPIQDIASEAGFESAQYFSLVFKKAMGLSPSEYQRIHYLQQS